MVLRNIFNYFINNPQAIDKLAESYPIRRAAQLTLYAYKKGKTVGEGIVQDGLQNGSQKLGSFSRRFQQEIEQGWKDASSAQQKKK